MSSETDLPGRPTSTNPDAASRLPTTQAKRCIVVGAGLAGMSAALYLAERGVIVELVEAHAYIGGRARSFQDEQSGEWIDNGQHLLMGCYTNVLHLIDALGTNDALREQSSLRVVFRERGSAPTVFGSNYLGGQLGAAEALMGLSGVSLIAKLKAVALMLRLQLGTRAKPHESARDFLERFGQDSRLIERFWEPLILATLNADSSKVSASLLVEVLRRSILAGGRNASLLIPRKGLSDLFEGFEQRLASLGGHLRLRCELSELIYRGNTFVALGTRDEQEIRADAVILAIPPRALKRVGIDIPLQHSPIVSVYLWFDRDFVREDFCALLGTTTQWVFNRRQLCTCTAEQKERYPGHLSLTISAASALAEQSAERIVEHCVQELREVFSEAAAAKLLHSKVIKERFATVLCSPENERLRPSVYTDVPNRFLAGDWTNTGLPATLEGAAQSGIEAAKAVLMSLKSQQL